jgi:signal transduction histidine kinase
MRLDLGSLDFGRWCGGIGSRARRVIGKRRGVADLALAVVAVALIVALWQVLASFGSAKDDTVRAMRTELEAIARNAALVVDAPSHERIRGFGAADSPEFRALRDKLRSVRSANGLATELLTVRPAADHMEFVVMTNLTPFVGGACAARPEMRTALAEVRTISAGPYSTAWGSWLSAWAPIVDASGRAVGLVEVDRTVDELAAALRRRSWRVASLAVGALLAALALCAGLWALLVRPLRRLTDDVRRLGRGDLSVPLLRSAASDEVKRLADAFRSLVDDLRASRATVAAQRRRLAARSRKLRAANRTKERFLAMLSHEIRTPLNGTIGFLDLVLQSYARTPEESRQFLVNARESAFRLSRLVDAVIDLSQIEEGTLDVASVRTDLTAILLAELQGSRPMARARGLRSSLVLPASDFPPVLADPARLGQVVSVVVEHAIESTASGGISIVASVLDGGETARVCVRRDPGSVTADGDAPARLRAAMDDGARTTAPDGSGIALSLARGLVRAMGGRIEFSPAGDASAIVRFDVAVAASPIARRPAPRFTARGEGNVPAGA